MPADDCNSSSACCEQPRILWIEVQNVQRDRFPAPLKPEPSVDKRYLCPAPQNGICAIKCGQAPLLISKRQQQSKRQKDFLFDHRHHKPANRSVHQEFKAVLGSQAVSRDRQKMTKICVKCDLLSCVVQCLVQF